MTNQVRNETLAYLTKVEIYGTLLPNVNAIKIAELALFRCWIYGDNNRK